MTSEELELIDTPEVLKIIRDNKDEDPRSFALKFNRTKDYPARAIAEQIKCLQKAKKKLPGISNTEFVFESVALEQASSEVTAIYKSNLIEGNQILDLTGGLGIDSIYFAKRFEKVIYCEKNELLSKMYKRNIGILGLTNIEIVEGDGIEILEKYPDKYFNWIYVDPSRRDSGRRFVGLEACMPDIILNIEILLSKSESILIKASPAIDYSKVKAQLPFLSRFIAVSVDGECKEILLIISAKKNKAKTLIEATVLGEKYNSFFHIIKNEEEFVERKITAEINQYFYEPDAAIIKSGLSSKLAVGRSLCFINNSVDYLTGKDLIPDFPGKVFKTFYDAAYNKKNLKEYIRKNSMTSANIARRDFPDSPEQIRVDLKLKDGGEDFLFFTKNHQNDFIFIHCKRVEK